MLTNIFALGNKNMMRTYMNPIRIFFTSYMLSINIKWTFKKIEMNFKYIFPLKTNTNRKQTNVQY